jgi:hypothetical protein
MASSVYHLLVMLHPGADLKLTDSAAGHISAAVALCTLLAGREQARAFLTN